VKSNEYVSEIDGYVFLDLRSSHLGSEIAAAYREFAVVCIDKGICRAVVATGSDEPSAHWALRDAFTTIVLAIGIPRAFKLALVSTSVGVQATHRTMQRDFRILGIETRIFAETDAAIGWTRQLLASTRT
jgi:hypothetical protein